MHNWLNPLLRLIYVEKSSYGIIDATVLEISQKLHKRYRYFANIPRVMSILCNIERSVLLLEVEISIVFASRKK